LALGITGVDDSNYKINSEQATRLMIISYSLLTKVAQSQKKFINLDKLMNCHLDQFEDELLSILMSEFMIESDSMGKSNPVGGSAILFDFFGPGPTYNKNG